MGESRWVKVERGRERECACVCVREVGLETHHLTEMLLQQVGTSMRLHRAGQCCNDRAAADFRDSHET